MAVSPLEIGTVVFLLSMLATVVFYIFYLVTHEEVAQIAPNPDPMPEPVFLYRYGFSLKQLLNVQHPFYPVFEGDWTDTERNFVIQICDEIQDVPGGWDPAYLTDEIFAQWYFSAEDNWVPNTGIWQLSYEEGQHDEVLLKLPPIPIMFVGPDWSPTRLEHARSVLATRFQSLRPVFARDQHHADPPLTQLN